MNFLTDWISNIVLIILLAVIVDLLIPNSSFQKYIKMVVGLLLILAILNPMLKIAGSNVDKVFEAIGVEHKFNENDIKISIEKNKREIQDSQSAYILEQTRVHMENLVKEELKANYGVTILSLQLIPKNGPAQGKLKANDIDSVHVIIGQGGDKKDIMVPAVKNVEINADQPVQKEKETQIKANPVQTFLAKKWQMKKENVLISTEGGEENGG
ncbi:stage III sporulation protein AF [Fictibacillus sp. B-59209]|uniref:stage III sporulation protein AF n=1 Tax=Fictibacillus sp. B-59209 TaxID=3024873 RepID=UPI002E2449E1|nr:stage III sporulation protein AF [Fictibacillus sp. B-59209]